MPDLLLELRSEEIPALMQEPGAKELRTQVCNALQSAGLTWDAERLFWSPRRIAVAIVGLPTQSAVQTTERRGPATDAPDKAVDGFCRANGVTRPQLEQRDANGRSYYFATITRGGQPIVESLAAALPLAIGAVRWPKSMRWTRDTFRWVRPLRSILCLLSENGRSIPVEFAVAGIRSGRLSYGHPVHQSHAIEIESVASYPTQLAQYNVMLAAEDRIASITQFMDSVAVPHGPATGRTRLIAEVANLVEWPEMCYQPIADEFRALPAALVRTAIWHHQKFIPVFSSGDETAGMVAGYVVVADHVATAQHPKIFAGYARVLRARLADAQFFWRNDLDAGMARMNQRLHEVSFFGGLGSVAQRVARITQLVGFVAERMGVNRSLACRAAELCKADLASETVGEFPELQGIIGSHLAQAAGEPSEVVTAIARQYELLDAASVGSLSDVAACLMIADHADKLYGLFAVGERPTGSRDPYALRRAAGTLLRALLIRRAHVSLHELLRAAAAGYAGVDLSHHADAAESATSFIMDRLHGMVRNGELPMGVMTQTAIQHDEVAAIATLMDEDDPVRFVQRVNDLSAWLTSDAQADDLLTAYHRASNILVAENVARNAVLESPNASLYQHPAERTLASQLTHANEIIDGAMAAGKFPEAIAAVSGLRSSIDAFFEQVTVNCEMADLRQNRLRLLTQLRTVMERVAAFAELEGR